MVPMSMDSCPVPGAVAVTPAAKHLHLLLVKVARAEGQRSSVLLRRKATTIITVDQVIKVVAMITVQRPAVCIQVPSPVRLLQSLRAAQCGSK